MTHKRRANRAAAIVAALSMLGQPAAHLTAVAAGQSPPAAKPATTPRRLRPRRRPSPPPNRRSRPSPPPRTPVDGGWPRMYSLPSEGSILVYQPQVSSWDKQTRMEAFSAVSYRSKAGDKPALGTIKIEADTKVAVADRLVSFQKMKITEANFQTLPKEQIREITDAIDKAIPDDERVIALDRVLANIDKSQIVPKNVEGIKADPPDHLLQQDARGHREPRRGADLEPDQGERSEVRGQHELGPVSARPDKHLLPAEQRHLAESQ